MGGGGEYEAWDLPCQYMLLTVWCPLPLHPHTYSNQLLMVLTCRSSEAICTNTWCWLTVWAIKQPPPPHPPSLVQPATYGSGMSFLWSILYTYMMSTDSLEPPNSLLPTPTLPCSTSYLRFWHVVPVKHSVHIHDVDWQFGAIWQVPPLRQELDVAHRSTAEKYEIRIWHKLEVLWNHTNLYQHDQW